MYNPANIQNGACFVLYGAARKKNIPLLHVLHCWGYGPPENISYQPKILLEKILINHATNPDDIIRHENNIDVPIFYGM